MAAQNLLHICQSNPVVGSHNEWKIKVERILFYTWIEDFMTVPLTWCIVVLIEYIGRSKNMAEIPAVLIRVEMILFNKLLNTF